MFTGIIQSTATIKDIKDHNGLRTILIEFQEDFCKNLEIGASIAVDGVCLTVTKREIENRVYFDIMSQSLGITTLKDYKVSDKVNVERAAKDGDEIGGHPLSGHIDFKAKIIQIEETDGNYRLRLKIDEPWDKYIFSKGYIALNGASLTVSDTNKEDKWFEVWLIPETRKMTTFNLKDIGDYINIEIERETQVIVDTVRDVLKEQLKDLMPTLEAILGDKGVSLESLGQIEKR